MSPELWCIYEPQTLTGTTTCVRTIFVLDATKDPGPKQKGTSGATQSHRLSS